MATRQIEKEHWTHYFNNLSNVLGTELAEIEVAGLDLGDQVEAEWLQLNGVSYDPRDDVLSLQLEGIEHLVRGPREVYVEEDDNGLHSLEVVDGEGHRHIVKLRAALALPSPA